MPNPNPNFIIKPATSSSDLTTVRSLFTSYASSLPIDLSFQNFATELASLPGAYSEPEGTILLAYPISSPASTALGCIALRPLKIDNGKRLCEMKRLYCIDEARGLGIGKALVEEALQKATEIGYEEIRLDTLASMVEARGMYERMGFEEMKEGYYDTKGVGTIFMCKKLR